MVVDLKTEIKCQVDIPNVSGLKDQELTVGREFFLNCTGEWPKTLIQEKLKLEIPEVNKYQIEMLGFEFRTADRADLKVTTYKAGPTKLEHLKLTDGTQTIDLGPIEFQVQTVIEKPQDPQAKIEPFGSIGPAPIAIPTVYILSIILVIVLGSILIAGRIFRFLQRKRMLAKLKEHDSALAPLQQFHQTLRKLQRDNPIFFGAVSSVNDIEKAFEDLHQMFLLFLIRELHVPALNWNNKLILKDIKKYHRESYDQQGLELKKLLREYSQATKNKNTLSDKDILVLADHTRRLVEKIDKIQTSLKRGAK